MSITVTTTALSDFRGSGSTRSLQFPLSSPDRHATPLPGFNRFRGDRVNEEDPSKTSFEDLPRRGRLARRRWRQPGGPVRPCCNWMLARRSGAGTGIRPRHVPDTSRNGGIDEVAAYTRYELLLVVSLEPRGWCCSPRYRSRPPSWPPCVCRQDRGAAGMSMGWRRPLPDGAPSQRAGCRRGI